MKVCSSCQQAQATVLVTELVHGDDPTTVVQVREQELCDACAQGQNLPHNPALKKSPQEILKLLHASAQRSRREPTIQCPDCGMTLLEFRQKGRMGCPKDYEVFGAHARELLERIHGATAHVGRLPGQDAAGLERSRRMSELQKELEAAIRQEAYEQAARLRDELKSLQSS
ncbi:MAG TPA: UvrB/UvrC motif-containing protein [Planctomycetota bacterium]|nr:UvrB/UvrC motif-containing protein [Planctomycetota bacterium]